jgi:hypothetical protein
MTTAASISQLPHSADADPIAAPLREVIAVFNDDLQGVRFPDVDAAVLADDVKVVEGAAAEVARAEAALEAARRVLDDAQDALLGRASRAVAYGRVFAIGNDALMARLDGILLPRPRVRGAAPSLPTTEQTKRRGRKSTPPSETLFAGPTLVEDEAAAAE